MSFLKNLFGKKTKIKPIELARRFDLVGRVGQGSMSKVWKARDSMSGKIVAVKVLDLDKTKRFEARFPAEWKKPSEGEIAVTLKHPHVVKTLEYGYTLEREQFLVMEFVEGPSLSFLIEVQNELMQSQRVRLVVELGRAIEYFHRENWIHRDICPRNVMLDADDRVKLIDFGLVVPNTPHFRKPGNRTGTANYMAPELIKRQSTDQRIDIYSFSVTAYEMFTKRFPWPATAGSLDAALAHINAAPDDIRDYCRDIDDQVANAIMKGLATDPRDRWQTMGEMLTPLHQAQVRLGQVVEEPVAEE